jgi:hypothetical protein
MILVSQMLSDCLSYESRRRELIARCEQLLERVDHLLARLYGEDAPADLTSKSGNFPKFGNLPNTDADAVADLTAVWRQLIQDEWTVLDLRRELEAQGIV